MSNKFTSLARSDASVEWRERYTPTIIHALLFSTLFLCTIATFPARAQLETSSEDYANYRIHYSVFDSQFLLPTVAKLYQLTRGKGIAYLNIATTKKIGEHRYGLGQPAKVTGSAKNLLGQQQMLEFFTVEEGNTTYYLAPLRFAHQEILHFSVRIQPADSSMTIPLKFQRKFYTDNALYQHD